MGGGGEGVTPIPIPPSSYAPAQFLVLSDRGRTDVLKHFLVVKEMSRNVKFCHKSIIWGLASRDFLSGSFVDRAVFGFCDLKPYSSWNTSLRADYIMTIHGSCQFTTKTT